MRKIACVLVCLFLASARVSPSSRQLSFLVFPPENLTKDTALSWIGEGVCQAVTEQIRISGIEAFRREERLSFVEGADMPPNTTLSRASMIRIAQQVSADRLIMGSYSGTEENLRVGIRVLEMKSLKLSEETVASGPLESLPGMENDLAWTLLSGTGMNGIYSRDTFRGRKREIPNTAYAAFIQSLANVEQDEQIRLLVKAVELRADFPEAQYYLGRHYHEQGDCQAAIRHLSAVGSRRPSFAEDQFIIGNCYLNLNDPDNAIRGYSASHAVVQSSHALNNSGVAHVLKGDLLSGVRCLMEASALSNTDSTITLNLAVAKHLQGDDAAARVLLEGLVRTFPNRGMIQYLLGLVLGGLGEADQAGRASALAREWGIDLEKMNAAGPRGWLHLFPSLETRP